LRFTSNNSFGHSFVLYNENLYTFINGSLYSVTIDVPNNFATWQMMNTSNNLYKGLYDYGIEVTPRGRLIMYGGFSSSNQDEEVIEIHSDLWFLNLDGVDKEFKLLNASFCGGGFSRIVFVGKENVLIINPTFLNDEIILLDVENWIWSRLVTENWISNRTSFAITDIGRQRFLLVGGFMQNNSIIEELDMTKFFSVLGYRKNEDNILNTSVIFISVGCIL
jgi:hypothetical protein